MTVTSYTRRVAAGVRALRWAPPTLTTPTTINVTQSANRQLSLDNATDYIIQLPAQALSDAPDLGIDMWMMLQIRGGRNIKIMGGQINVPARTSTVLSADMSAVAASCTVPSTTGFPSSGQLRINGELITYTGTTATTFTGLGHTGTVFSPGVAGAQVAGTPVYQTTPTRGGLYLQNQTGTVHVEGLLIDGPGLTEGIWVQSEVGVYQFQNLRVGPVSATDTVNLTDNHPDCIQALTGPTTLRLDKCTFLTNHQGVIVKRDFGTNYLGALEASDVNVIDSEDPAVTRDGFLWHLFDPLPVYVLRNCWALPNETRLTRTRGGSAGAAGSTGAPIVGAPRDDFCPAGVPGLAYTSPGYLP
jgi:hypothetical protein